MLTFADKVIDFNKKIHFEGQLPDGIRIMNPFRDTPSVLATSSAFYKKYYDDFEPRHLILGINPGRHGAGLTGVPFTDPKRLKEKCGVDFEGTLAHEPSSVFVYEIIETYGGLEAFYRDFYINSPCPLGFTKINERKKEVNYNYYDSKTLTEAVSEFMVESMEKHLALGIKTDVAFCLGAGQNFKFLSKLNKYIEKENKILRLLQLMIILVWNKKEVNFVKIGQYLAKI
ncbi:MAG: DUF4918 family protein [Saprospiraceae bacterium]|nr:DUF4918 family protein [Saprospiraceae bacterium]